MSKASVVIQEAKQTIAEDRNEAKLVVVNDLLMSEPRVVELGAGDIPVVFELPAGAEMSFDVRSTFGQVLNSGKITRALRVYVNAKVAEISQRVTETL